MGKVDKIIFWTLSVVLLFSLSWFNVGSFATKHLDSVFLCESADSILRTGSATSESVASWPDALKTFIVPPEVLCTAPLVPSQHEYNVFDNHAYSILYLLAPLTAILGAETAFSALGALAHAGLLVLPLWFLRKRGVGWIPSAVFALCIALYPAWSYSAIGDFYLDRLFMPLALLALYRLHELANDATKADCRVMINVVGIMLAAALCTERGAIMMIGTCIYFIALFPRIRSAVRAWSPLAGTALALLIYLVLYLSLFYKGIEGSGGMIANSLAAIKDPIGRLRAPGFLPFAMVNFLLLGCLIPFAGVRYGLLAVAALVPNFLTTVGGAELNGWPTHYHTMYIPYLIFTASLGYQRLSVLCAAHPALRHGTPLAIGCGMLAVAATLQPATGRFSIPSCDAINQGVLGRAFAYFFTPSRSNDRAQTHYLATLNDVVPRGASVATAERAMPSLFRGRHLTYFPMGMDTADYVVIGGIQDAAGAIRILGAVTYLGADKGIALNRCLYARMLAHDFHLVENVSPIGLLVFRRGSGGIQGVGVN